MALRKRNNVRNRKTFSLLDIFLFLMYGNRGEISHYIAHLCEILLSISDSNSVNEWKKNEVFNLDILDRNQWSLIFKGKNVHTWAHNHSRKRAHRENESVTRLSIVPKRLGLSYHWFNNWFVTGRRQTIHAYQFKNNELWFKSYMLLPTSSWPLRRIWPID